MMFRYKSHKKALIMTALVILLCLVCLTGATLALFTSDLNDGTIGVITTAGDVKIDIVDTSGATLQNKALDFITASDSPIDSGNVLFEPGATFRTQGFKVKNTGDIPVNFSLSVSKDDRIDMEEFDKAFELWIVKEGEDFSSAKKITNFKVYGLGAGDNSDTYYLFIKMKESVGNEFGGKTYTGIGVTVYAVQGNAELN
jgi:hypothetical protein